MPLVNIGYQRIRNRLFDIPSADQGPADKAAVDSLGFGTDNAAEARSDTQLNEAGGGNSYWKTGVADPASGNVTYTTSGSTDDENEDDPWAQLVANWSEVEISAGGEVTLYEAGSSAGSLNGTDPAGNDGTNLFSRKRIGGTGGIGKTDDVQLELRKKFTF